jgi:hypothetical protein
VIRTVIDSRPPARSWLPALITGVPDRPPLGQPSLLDDEPDSAPRPSPQGIRYQLCGGPGSLTPAAGLPDPAHWSAVLALALAQTLSGIRPAGQLERWLDDAVLADVRCILRSRQRSRARAEDRGSWPKVPAIKVASVRAQCPTPTAVESAAHLRVGSSSLALALRLEACGDRWLATALELGPLPWDVSGLSEPRSGRDTS